MGDKAMVKMSRMVLFIDAGFETVRGQTMCID